MELKSAIIYVHMKQFLYFVASLLSLGISLFIASNDTEGHFVT